MHVCGICIFDCCNFSSSEMGLEEEAPPLPPRLYSWSDMEDNDDELFQSDDDLDDTSAPVTISDHQKIYASVCTLSIWYYAGCVVFFVNLGRDMLLQISSMINFIH